MWRIYKFITVWVRYMKIACFCHVSKIRGSNSERSGQCWHVTKTCSFRTSYSCNDEFVYFSHFPRLKNESPTAHYVNFILTVWTYTTMTAWIWVYATLVIWSQFYRTMCPSITVLSRLFCVQDFARIQYFMMFFDSFLFKWPNITEKLFKLSKSIHDF